MFYVNIALERSLHNKFNHIQALIYTSINQLLEILCFSLGIVSTQRLLIVGEYCNFFSSNLFLATKL